MRVALLFSGLLLFSSSAFAVSNDCSSEANQHISNCKMTVQAADQANKGLADAGKKAASGQGQCGVGGNQAGTNAPAADNMSKTQAPCAQEEQKCIQECQQAEDKAKQRLQQGDPSAAQDIFQARHNSSRCQSEIPAEMARAKAAQGTSLADGVGGGANTQSESCNNQKKDEKAQAPQIPQIPPPQKGGDSPQQASATPASTDSATTPSCESTNSCLAQDGGQRAAFASPKADRGTQYASLNPTSGLTTSSATGLSGISAPSASGGGGASSSGGGKMGTSSVNPNDKADKDRAAAALKKALGEGADKGKALDNEFGTDGGGGGGMNSASFESSLADYLPGGAKDPTKNENNRQLAGATPPPAHPDIVSKSQDLFSGVSKKMHLICDMKEFIGCN